VAPAVVTVRCVPKSDDAQGRGAARLPRAMSVGSGIVLDSLGRILTTARVVEGSDDFWIELWDGRLFRAVMLGANRDVAVLQIDAKGLYPAEYGDATELGVGSSVAAVGNSYGYSGGLSWGVVNGFRPDGTIQLSLGVSAGSSGGALVDFRGRIVGLIKAKISEPYYIDPLHLPADDGQPALVIPGRRLELPTSSVSLAIPIGTALRAAARLTESGQEVPAYVGVYVEDLTGWYTAHFKTQNGVLVTGVVEFTPAHRFGLLRGDVITRIDREQVHTVQRFRQIVAQAQPGQRMLFDLLRGGKPLKLVIEAGRADIPHLGNTEAPAAARSVPPASVTRPSAVRSEGVGALKLLNQAGTDTMSAASSPSIDWGPRLERLERTIDSLKQELSRARRRDSP
jgi:S1-C subfamily serine protease